MNETKTTPKDFFLNLGAIIALYFSLISLLNLIFTIINKFFPDALSYGYDVSSSTVRWTISSLIILFPLYVYLSNLINKDIAANPQKKNIWIKKWSSFLTLFLTGATIAVDLIILINTFLGGEITTRFILKVLVVLIVVAFVFSYYLYDLRRTEVGRNKTIRLMVIIASVVVLISLIGGFFAAGSPFAERQKRFDDRRTQDLSTIQYQIINYWQKKGALPDSLSDLNDPLSAFAVPTDPESGAQYEYTNEGTTSFNLCATFDLPSRDIMVPQYAYPAGPVMMNESFNHKTGHTCFERIIDPSLYPPVKK